MSSPETILDNPEATPSRLEPLLFGSTLAIATVLYLATDQPILAASLPCLHGGWKTFRTGLWLLRCDSDRSRARTCFAFYVAAACWNAAAAALAAVGLFIVAATKFGFQPDMDEFAATMLALAGGVVLNTLVGLGAIYMALALKIRVWVHPRLRTATHGDLRLVAGLKPHRSGFNHAIFVVVTALVFPVVGAGAVGLAFLTLGKNPNNLDTIPAMCLAFGMMFGGPLAMVPCYAWLSSRIIARSPHEGWPKIGQPTGTAEASQHERRSKGGSA